MALNIVETVFRCITTFFCLLFGADVPEWD